MTRLRQEVSTGRGVHFRLRKIASLLDEQYAALKFCMEAYDDVLQNTITICMP